MTDKIGSRRFTLQQQADFADLSGDYNPIHIDPVAARRTQAGAPVVHGVHVLLWCLERLASTASFLPPLAQVKVKFTGFVYLDDDVEAYAGQLTPRGGRLEVRAADTVVCRISLHFDSAENSSTPSGAKTLSAPAGLAHTEQSDAEGGLVRLPNEASASRAFPRLLSWVGSGPARALLGATQLVGMICPGLHSIFAGLDLKLGVAPEPLNELAWAVVSRDERYRHVAMRVLGAGVSGEVESFARLPPVEQPSMAEVAPYIKDLDLSGSNVLVIGGSRGLGELIAKLAASAAARVTITYASGQADAEQVATQIRGWGGTCDTLQYRAGSDAGLQLSKSGANFTHIYHFASPLISRRKLAGFDFKRFSEFCEIYNEAFSMLCTAALSLRPAGVVAFYPSTVFINEKRRASLSTTWRRLWARCSAMNSSVSTLA